MPAPRERLIRKLTRIQEFGETSLFFVFSGPGGTCEGRGTDTRGVQRPGAAAVTEAESAVATEAAGDALLPETGTAPAPDHRRLEPDSEPDVERRWRALEQEVRACTRCRLCENRTNAVFGSGTRHTRLFVIGEGPGEVEDRRGEAFVGPAGELLTRILKAIGFARDQVFITNIVKCRPPRNRAPLPDEVAACAGYLQAQLAMVRPVVILTLGGSATQALLGTPMPISRMRGRVHMYRGIPVVPTYHPAALLRSPQYKRPTWEDVQLLRRVYDERLAALGEAP